jgi:hypothetical protein
MASKNKTGFDPKAKGNISITKVDPKYNYVIDASGDIYKQPKGENTYEKVSNPKDEMLKLSLRNKDLFSIAEKGNTKEGGFVNYMRTLGNAPTNSPYFASFKTKAYNSFYTKHADGTVVPSNNKTLKNDGEVELPNINLPNVDSSKISNSVPKDSAKVKAKVDSSLPNINLPKVDSSKIVPNTTKAKLKANDNSELPNVNLPRVGNSSSFPNTTTATPVSLPKPSIKKSGTPGNLPKFTPSASDINTADTNTETTDTTPSQPTGGFNPDESGTISILDHDKAYDYHIKPDGSIFVNKKGSKQYTSLDTLPADKQAEARTKLTEYSTKYPDAGGQELTDRIALKGRADTSINPLPTKTAPLVGGSASIVPTSLPNTAKPYNFDDASLGGSKPGDMFDAIKADIDLQAIQNEQNYAKDQQNIKDVYNRKDRLAAGNLITGLVKDGLQDTSYDPKTQTTSFVQSQYRGVPNSVIEAQSTKLREQTAGLGRELLAGGARPSEVASILAGAQGKTVGAEGDMRFNFYKNQYDKDAEKYKELRGISNFNKAAVITANEAQRDDQNQLLNAVGENFQSFLENKDANVTNQFEANNAATAAYNKNKGAITQNDINITGSMSGLQATQDYNAQFFKYLDDYFKKNK